MKEYLGNEEIYNEFIHRSNQIMKHDLTKELRKPKYFMNEELEEKAREEIRREHLKMTDEYFDNFIQSGAPQVMPFKRLRAAF